METIVICVTLLLVTVTVCATFLLVRMSDNDCESLDRERRKAESEADAVRKREQGYINLARNLMEEVASLKKVMEKRFLVGVVLVDSLSTFHDGVLGYEHRPHNPSPSV